MRLFLWHTYVFCFAKIHIFVLTHICILIILERALQDGVVGEAAVLGHGIVPPVGMGSISTTAVNGIICSVIITDAKVLCFCEKHAKRCDNFENCHT